MPKRKKKKYNRPRRLYDSVRIKKENEFVKKYGLKNKREIWKADFAIGKIRDTAKKLITADEKEKQKFIERQKAKGFEVNSIADILGLNKEDYLKRRLQSILVKKNLARTPKQARQFIAHRQVEIKGCKIDCPSHLTTLKEEESIKVTAVIPLKKESKGEEIKAKEEKTAEENKVKENE